jgi:hypothetical protein
LFPFPWITYALPVDPNARIYAVTSASTWQELLERFPAYKQDEIFPDWPRIAEMYDGVHFSLEAIIVLQGFQIPLHEGTSSPGFWDVEQTFWLTWKFGDVVMIDKRVE